ncbi:DUF411 domain-containing protein [Sphingomonas lycopersici]|uniref:DUF411 domain-containing protein n=1 Tax=Sphingomonas lycopersici TaxID=2951807 RepID=A0AA42CNC3_9SPHN|nr:DUF411 domain-containing protein [Sphingomonas lycopersici]MCW6533420.1 DUF411 domain-containing protein [Sphingomonas lycopersici]
MLSFNAGNSARLRLAGAALTLLAACSGVAQATTYTMYRDPGCGCCTKWAEHMRAALKAQITVVETRDVAAVAAQRGVPAALRSCHTLIAGGYVIEGHVPAADIARLLAMRPKGVTGLAVPGMPLGSPGMEAGREKQPYQVIAFGSGGQRVFSSHNR